MSNNNYQDLVEQAWTTYTKVHAKVRGGEYAKLLDPLYADLFEQLSGIDALVTALGKTNPPSETALNDAEKKFGLLESTLENFSGVFAKFPEMDNAVISKAAALDQSALKVSYADVQAADEVLFATFATTVLTAQESAARTMSVYHQANVELATSGQK